MLRKIGVGYVAKKKSPAIPGGSRVLGTFDTREHAVLFCERHVYSLEIFHDEMWVKSSPTSWRRHCTAQRGVCSDECDKYCNVAESFSVHEVPRWGLLNDK